MSLINLKYHISLYYNFLIQMEENIGMVMGFTVISAGLEWLGNKWDSLQQEEEERIKKQKELDEEAEKVRHIAFVRTN